MLRLMLDLFYFALMSLVVTRSQLDDMSSGASVQNILNSVSYFQVSIHRLV